MAWTIFFILTFSILALIPLIWSFFKLRRETPQLVAWIIGMMFTALLLFITFGGMIFKWPPRPGITGQSGTSEGAVICVPPPTPTASPCEADIWILEYHHRVVGPNCPRTTTTVPEGTFCPPGQSPVFDFCERMQTGGIKQPWATWSDLSFIAAGFWLFWMFQYYDRMRSPDRRGKWIVPLNADNPMVTIGALSVVYALVTIFMGPPSMWYHASIKEWAGWFDAMSVATWLFFNAAYVWVSICGPMWGKLRGIGRPITVLCIWGGFLLTLGPIAYAVPDFRLALYFIAGGSWGLGEIMYLILGCARHSDVRFKRNGWLFLANFIVLAGTMTIWVFWNPSVSALTPPDACQARSVFPGHAVFHIMASLSTLITFFSFASEKPESGS